jgi:MoaA/NifB/PqqE/SkfB family radical SAM enzyme
MKVFQWGTGTMPRPRMSRFLDSYGPYAIHANFCNYGEPLINPDTPRFVREAKGYLIGTMLSTNLSLPRLNAEAVVASGLDYMLISVDGATQEVYQKFRRKGQLDLVLRNIERLVAAKREQGRKTPVLVWRLITWQHNIHEIPLAIETARQLGVDQFVTTEAQDVTWDDPNVRAAHIEPVNVMFNRRAQLDILDNWNAFPDDLNTASIDRAFEARWIDPDHPLPTEWAGKGGAGETCNWLYKSISVDASGRIIPCCASPRPDADLVFGEFDDMPSQDIFNSEKYRLSRLAFADRESYRQAFADSGLSKDPFCARCDWDKETTNARGDNITSYFQAADRELFNSESLGILSNW